MWDKCSPRCGTLLTLETFNSRRCRQSDWPEVKMHYWGLLRMWKTKLESLFSSRRLATCVSEVVFGRWVVIHFFCLLLNMPWKKNHIPVFLRIPWSQLTKLKLFTYWRTFSSFIVIVSPEIMKAKKNNVSKHLLLSFMFIWSQTEYCRISDVLQGQVAITVMAWFSFGRHK